MALLDYKVTHDAINDEIALRTSRLVSNTRRSITFYFAERRSALDYVVGDRTLEELLDPERLSFIIVNLKRSFGGFLDIGVIDHLGIQRSYVGPYALEGVDYSNEEWFRQVVEKGTYISDVFEGFRHVPHLVIAIRHPLPDGAFYVVRTTIDTASLNRLLGEIDVGGEGDAFVINRRGNLQTPSRFYGKVLDKMPIPVPSYSERTIVLDTVEPTGNPLVVSYAYIEDTPFVLMICKQKRVLLKPWEKAKFQLVGFLAVSVIVILLVIVGVSTYLVSRIHEADMRRVATLHQIEYANKMASIGRLASGVAHEINNPLAVINEKAGLVKDLFTFGKIANQEQRIIGLIDAIQSSVDRCATITRRLLGFARHMGGNSQIQSLKLGEVIEEVLGFLQKEAEYRSIAVSVAVTEETPPVECDRGKLQQILLNVINNAFAAMNDGGRLEVAVKPADTDHVSITIKDDGSGIPEVDLPRIFEPFFSTKMKQGGTGLGLSITYGLVKEIGGEISVASSVGKGTTFTVLLPLMKKKKEGA
jgi:signal transduction histidine kinase